MSRPVPASRESFPWFTTLDTRWADSDMYGHCNNVAYYAWFDTAVNRYYIDEGGFRPLQDKDVGFVVSSGCDYFAPIEHPSVLEMGLRVARLGGRSVTWEVGVFVAGDAESRATGRFVHAFVNQPTGQSADIPPDVRAALERLTPAE